MILSTAVRNARAQSVVDSIDGGSGAGVMKFYSADDTLLAENVLSDPSGVVSNGVLVFSSIADDISVNSSGELSYCNIVDSDDTFCVEMSVGLSGSGAEIIVTSLSVIAGGYFKILNGSFTEGNA